MLLKSIEDIGLRLASLTAAIYAAEKTNIMRQFVQSGDSDIMLAVKVSAFLTSSEYVGDMLLSYALHRTAPKLYVGMSDLPYAFISNTIVLYAMERLKLDNKIITSSTAEGKAVQWAVLYIIVQELSNRLLQMLPKQYN
jgi:hypothetical protein